jgi:hypothetical protein
MLISTVSILQILTLEIFFLNYFINTAPTVTGVIIAPLALLSLTGFLLAFCISLEYGLHKSHALIAPRLLVELLGLRGLTCCCLEGLTIAVIVMAVQGVVGLVETTVGFATPAKLFTATLLRESTSWAPRHLALRITLGLRLGCSSLTFCLKLLIVLLNYDPLDCLKVW